MALRIALAGGGPRGEDVVEGIEAIRRWPQPCGGGILRQPRDMAGTRYRYDERLLRQQPGERQLRRRAALGGRVRLQFLDQRQVAGEVFLLEPRHAAARVLVGERGAAGHRPGQKAAPEGAVRDEADPEFLA